MMSIVAGAECNVITISTYDMCAKSGLNARQGEHGRACQVEENRKSTQLLSMAQFSLDYHTSSTKTIGPHFGA